MSRWSLFLRLVGFLRPFAGWVALSILLGVATIASGIGLLGTSASLIAQAALHPSVAALQVAIVGVRFFGISRAVFRYLERLVSHSTNFHLLAALRAWFYRQIEPLAPAGLQDERSGDLLSRAIADIDTLENFYVRAVAPPLVALVVTLGMGWFVGRYDPRFTIVLVTALVANGVLLPLLAYFLSRKPAQEGIDRRARLNTSLLDAIQGLPDLLAFGQAQNQLALIEAEGAALGQAQIHLAHSGALANALGNLAAGLALWGILFVGIPMVNEPLNGITLAVLALVTLASFEAVNPLVQASQHLESSLQAARRLFSLVLVEPEFTLPPQPAPAPKAMPLRIRGLTFAYQNDRAPALIDFDLDLPVGKKVALLGVSGAGKSTLFNLLMRFWEFKSGMIELGGCDIRRYDPQDVRRQIALIDSSTYLFTGTLRQNLLVAKPSAKEAELDRVIGMAQMSGVVDRLPAGMDTWLGERGVQLSGGERQRVAIARALLKDAALLLLDEPTANLDPENERSLLNALRQASAGRSLIFITHSLMGVEGMDEIIILSSGRVVERGTHAGLQRMGGEYSRFWNAAGKYLVNM